MVENEAIPLAMFGTPMKDLRIPLRIVLYEEGGRWIAHCLEFDLLGDGVTRRESFQSLEEAIHLQIEETLQHNNFANLFSPADGEVFELFAAGTDCSEPECRLDLQSLSQFPVVIESIQVRDYRESSAPTIV